MKTIFGEIISVGSELLDGDHPETNSLFLSEKLAKQGIQVRWKTVVGDVPGDIAGSLTQAIRRATVVILSGGLGSTVDDCTRDVVAEVTKRPLRSRKKAVDHLRARYDSAGRTFTRSLMKQAFLPSGSKLLENPVGSASGFLVKHGRCVIVALPGVSREAKAMFDDQVTPKIDQYLKPNQILNRHVFKIFGLTESEVDDRLQAPIKGFPSLTFGLLTSPLGVTVTVSTWSGLPRRGPSKSQPPHPADFHNAVTELRRCLGEWLYAEGDRGMEEVVGQELLSQNVSVGVAESCTGGLIGHRLTQVPGSSRYVDRVLVCYTNQAKHELLGVPNSLFRRYGAVSSLVARAMARGVRQRSQSGLGLSVTGIAGPGGGSKLKPVGLVFIGIDGPKGTKVKKFYFQGDRESIKLRASQAALNMVRQYLLP